MLDFVLCCLTMYETKRGDFAYRRIDSQSMDANVFQLDWYYYYIDIITELTYTAHEERGG